MKGQILSTFEHCRKAGAVAWKKVNSASLVAAVALTSVPAIQAQAEDLFSGGKSTMTDTFGGNSTVVWILYVLEILAAVFTYVKTKNLAMFGGIAAVLVFVNVAFSILP